MARLAGVNIPDKKHAAISLTYIFGIGNTTARKLCNQAGVNQNEKIHFIPICFIDIICLWWWW